MTIIAEYIQKNHYDTDWGFVANISGVDIEWESHPRLIRSQTFRDNDYPSAILRFLADLFLKNKDGTRQAIAYIIQSDDLSQLTSPYQFAFSYVGVIAGVDSTLTIPKLVFSVTPYLDIKTLPDDYYLELSNQVNRAYSYGLYTAAQILLRKLFETALIDVLRKKYGNSQIDVFYYAPQGRFHDFNKLIENTREMIEAGDFISVKDFFNKDLLDRINKFRDSANARTHSLVLNVKKEEMDSGRDEINDIARHLFRTISTV